MAKADVVAALRTQRHATVRLLAALSPEQWRSPEDGRDGPSVRAVAASLVAVDEAAATGRLVPVLLRARDIGALYAWRPPTFEHWRAQPEEQLLEGLRRWGDRLATLAARVPALLERIDLQGPYGRQPLLYLLSRRVLDEWVHSTRVASTFGREVVQVDAAVAGTLAGAVLDGLPTLVLPRVQRTTGVVRLVVGYDAEAERRLTWGVDFARKHYGPRVVRPPDATIRVDATTLATLAEGLARLRTLEDVIEISGDQELADDLLEAIATPAERLRL